MPDAYSVFIRRDAEKELLRVPRHDAARLVRRIEALRAAPRPRGCEKLSTLERYRIRQGDWRVLYEVDDGRREVTMVRIAHRREAYR